MIHLLSIVGARPQIIKAAAISRAFQTHFSNTMEEHLLHTGQHYDNNMSQVFFDELGILPETYNLHIGSGCHGKQTAHMIEGIEAILTQHTYDGVIVYGDTNSTLAGAVAASKLHIPVFHIEAGLRSFNRSMPEEVNRIVADHLSSILFAPTKAAMENLHKEGCTHRAAVFANGKHQQVFESGDIMYDNALHYAHIATEQYPNFLSSLGVSPQNYVLATIHRDNNTDIPQRLTSIFQALYHLATTEKQAIVIPLHPRTSKVLENNIGATLYRKLQQCEYIRIIEPVSYLKMILLEKNATLIMTDSGGVQKEAYFFQKPCVILRSETEWVEIVAQQAGIVSDADTHRITEAYYQLINRNINYPPLYGQGNASVFVLEKIREYVEKKHN